MDCPCIFTSAEFYGSDLGLLALNLKALGSFFVCISTDAENFKDGGKLEASLMHPPVAWRMKCHAFSRNLQICTYLTLIIGISAHLTITTGFYPPSTPVRLTASMDLQNEGFHLLKV
ncbi:unnamed protein product [Caretta caretta]